MDTNTEKYIQSSIGHTGAEEDFEIRVADDVSSLSSYVGMSEDADVDIYVAEEDGELLGAAVYDENGDIGSLEYMEVFLDARGRGVGSALVDRMLDDSEAGSMYAHATAMDGIIQTMLQNRGFQVSGFDIGAYMSELDENTMEGFNLDMWRTGDSVQAYIPPELQEFADKSLESQRNAEYIEPDKDHVTGSFDFINRRDDRLEMSVGEGSTLEHHIEGAIEGLNNDDFWATTVEVDASEPIAYSLLDTLHNKGFRPVNFSPSVDGGELTMLDLKNESGEFRLTDESRELLETTGLDFDRTPQEDEFSDKFTLLPT